MPDTSPARGSSADPAEIARILEQGRAWTSVGDFRRAIDYVTEANRGIRSPELELELMRLRAEAFPTISKVGASTWPQAYEDPFPGLVGLPEIDAHALTAEIMGGAFQHHGALWVHGLLREDEAAMLRSGIDKAMAERDAFRAGTPENETRPWYSRIPVNEHIEGARNWVEEGGAVLTADSPRMMYNLLEAFTDHGTIDVISGYLGERPALSVGKSTLRRVANLPTADWHQDGSFLGTNIRTVNVWIALSDCGEDAPGLDIVAQRFPNIVQTGSHGAWFDWSVGQGMIEELERDGAPVVSPVFRPGDAVLFDQLMLHRTGISSHMTGTRWAVENWFFAPSTYPIEQGPLVV